ncbi:MAG: HD domain-containing protein [Candidatus Rokubacteria bacterium]|nr:HD domain-containing protein [Candidatus Rokubacteria bacterium]
MTYLRIERLAPAQIELLRAVAAASGRRSAAVLVGGAVRDALLGRQPAGARGHDVDVTVPAGALALARRIADRTGGAFVALDAERGAARVVLHGHRLDLTDLRAPTLEADLAAREFTVNALAVSLGDLLRLGRARVVDPTGGLADLRARRLRLPDPRALADDPLRALRGVRLEAALQFRLTPAAARAVTAAAPLLGRVSAERVRDELVALLALPGTAAAIRRADRLGLLRVVLPEVEAMRRTRQPAPHRFDVLEHSLRAVAGCDAIVARPEALVPLGEELAAHLAEPLAGGIERRHALKLAALLHDVAKPETRRVVGGRIRFFEHDLRGAARAREIGERLRLPGSVTDTLERLVRHHLRPMHLAGVGEPTPRARYRFYRDLGADCRDLLLLALADAAAVRGESPLRVWPRATLVRDLLRGWEAGQRTATTPPLLRGGDVMARFSLQPGPVVGWLLAQAREAQDLGAVRTREEALAYLEGVHARGAGR